MLLCSSARRCRCLSETESDERGSVTTTVRSVTAGDELSPRLALHFSPPRGSILSEQPPDNHCGTEILRLLVAVSSRDMRYLRNLPRAL